MDIKEKLRRFCQSLQIDAMGIVSWPLPPESATHLYEENPCPFTAASLSERLHGNTTITSPQCAIVCLFPYYVSLPSEHEKVNLARYTWGKDYHLVIPEYLRKIIAFLEKESTPHRYEFEIHCDTSPLADRYLAYLAGLGFYGKNRCFINPHYGSYVCIGTILTDLPLAPDKPLEETCLGCQRCLTACPGNALADKRFVYEHCKSYLTQKKGDLSEKEEKIIAGSPLIFGCDICQAVCPHNRNIPSTPFPEFAEVEPFVEPETLSTLTNKEFKTAFGDRSFAWRGKAILLRNHEIIKKYRKK